MSTTADMVKLVQTCGAFPEQYDAFVGDECVAYLRLRGGYFYVQCPHPYLDKADHLASFTSEVVYDADVGYGEFDTEEQREEELGKAKAAIAEWCDNRDRKPRKMFVPLGVLPEDVQRELIGDPAALLRDRPLLPDDNMDSFEIPKPR